MSFDPHASTLEQANVVCLYADCTRPSVRTRRHCRGLTISGTWTSTGRPIQRKKKRREYDRIWSHLGADRSTSRDLP